MKKILQMSFLLVAIALAGHAFVGNASAMGKASQQSAPANTAAAPIVQGDQVVVYYFHGTFRCPTCHKLEQYANEAIATNFKDALASGKLSFQVVNVENKGNEHYMNDYQLYTKSVVLSLTKDGKEIRSKNLDKIWQLVRSKEQYENYVRDEVAVFLKGT